MDSCSRGIDRVTTDAVHRRFLSRKKTKTPPPAANEEVENEDHYYCKQCKHIMQTHLGKGELKFHFENVKHKAFSNCVYCTKPVYDYRHKKKLEFYHKCLHD